MPYTKEVMPLLLAALLALGAVSSSSAFCIYNDGPQKVGVLQLPISGTSYKGNVDPGGGKDCCNWRDCQGEEPGRCGQSVFCMVNGGVDTAAITADANLQAALGTLLSALSNIPGIGALGDLNDQAKEALKNSLCTNAVRSYNGGIVTVDSNGGFHGKWDGANQDPPPGTDGC